MSADQIGGLPSSDSRAGWQANLVVADVMQWVAAGVLLNFVLFGDTSVSWLLRGATIGVLFFAAVRSHVWVLLIAIQSSLLMREPSRPEMSHELESFLYCFSALVLIAYASSLRTTRRHLRYWLASNLTWTLDGPSENAATRSFQIGNLRGMPRRTGILLATRVLLLAVVVLVSMLVFTHLPVSQGARQRWWQRSESSDLTLWPGPTVLVLAIALIVVFWQSEWRQITPAQARLVLRSAFLSSQYRDLKMIVSRRLRASKKDAKNKVRNRSTIKLAPTETPNRS